MRGIKLLLALSEFTYFQYAQWWGYFKQASLFEQYRSQSCHDCNVSRNGMPFLVQYSLLASIRCFVVVLLLWELLCSVSVLIERSSKGILMSGCLNCWGISLMSIFIIWFKTPYLPMLGECAFPESPLSSDLSYYFSTIIISTMSEWASSGSLLPAFSDFSWSPELPLSSCSSCYCSSIIVWSLSKWAPASSFLPASSDSPSSSSSTTLLLRAVCVGDASP